MPKLRARLAAHGLSLLLLCLCLLALLAVYRLDDRCGLYQNASNRYRFHAIPVALSHLYHGRDHDYTAWRTLARRFQDPADPQLDELIDRWADPSAPVGSNTYFWTADDRGLSDYVELAFWLHGPGVRSLSHFYFVLLGASVLLFAVGYWRDHLALALALLAVLGVLFLGCLCWLWAEVQTVDGVDWPEAVALYESRMFEVLATGAWLHLALLVVARAAPPGVWLTAIPQAGLLVFLYHARSSLGWQYLALFCLAGGRLLWLAQTRWRGGPPPAWRALARPLLVSALLAASLAGLHEYKRWTYHPAYFAARGARTFWHNALMGLGYHPRLQRDLKVEVEDGTVVDFVLRWLQERGDPRLTPRWTRQNILNSLGGWSEFDWLSYEQVAREIYFDRWKRVPGRMLACYFWYKPRAECQLVGTFLGRLAGRLAEESPRGSVAVGCLALGALLLAGYRIARDGTLRARLRGYAWLSLCYLCFSLIPATAFYAVLVTMSGFYVGLAICAGLGALLLPQLVFRPTPVLAAAPGLSDSSAVSPIKAA